jgi:hypothetical protein
MHIALFGLNAKQVNKETKVHTKLLFLKLILYWLKTGKAVVS